MLVTGFPAGAFATNCFVVAPGPGEECVVVDPGQDATNGLEDLLREHRLRPVAVLLTHGHLDHVWSVVPVCGAHDVPAWIHPADRHLLSDPEAGMGRALGAMIAGLTFTEPSEVREIPDGGEIELAGLRFAVDLAPGHTPGSVTFRLPLPGEGGEPAAPLLFAGDLLFAGSIGRTDLPGGSSEQMMESLARVCLPLPDDTTVLPGHGPATTIGRERAGNPFLLQLQDTGGGAPAPPRRGL